MKPEITVIIPAYNENEDIIPLIEAVKQSTSVNEIIVVDDASQPKYAEIYRSISDITLITHPKNKGKSPAVLTGIQAAKTDTIMILDADLLHVTGTHIDNLAQQIQQYDVICMIRGADSTFGKTVGSTYITRGEHLMKKSFIERFKDILFDGTRWGFDNNINDVLLRDDVTFTFAELVGVSHKMKSNKYSFVKGAVLDLQMFYLVVVKKYKIYQWVSTYIKLWPYIQKRLRIQSK